MMSDQNLTDLASKWCSRLINLCKDELTKRSLQSLEKYFSNVKEISKSSIDKQRLISDVYKKLLAIDQSPMLTDQILTDTLEFASSRIQTAAEIISTADEKLSSEPDELLFTVLSNFYLCFGSLILRISCATSNVTTTEVETKSNEKQELFEELLTTAHDDVIMELIEEDMPYDEYLNKEILACIQMQKYDESGYVKKTSEVIKKIEQKFKLPNNSLIEFITGHNSAPTRYNPSIANSLRDYVRLCDKDGKEPSISDFVIYVKLDCQVNEEYFSSLFQSYIEKVRQGTIGHVEDEDNEKPITTEPKPVPSSSGSSRKNKTLMNTSVRIFLDYLLDVETTSEVTFNEAILRNGELYDEDHLPHFEQIIENKLKQWKDFDQKERSAIVDGSKRKPQVEVTNDKSDDEWEEDRFTEAEQEQAVQRLQEIQAMEQDDRYLDTTGQCQRLLQLLYYCQQHYAHFSDLYLRTIDRCIKSDNEKVTTMALEQIVLHLSENKQDDQEQKRLLERLLPDTSSSTLSPVQQEILNKIQTLLSINRAEQKAIPIFSSDNIAELYPYKARFIDVRQVFRDSTHYFIDGDSLLLSIAHHTNVDLKSYYGNTVHVIYIIERILLMLSSQSNQCNYTLLFFDCHHRLYQAENSILTLLRACFISHFSKNIENCGIAQFSSWLDAEYVKFAQEEKPMFLFYHDMSSFDLENDPFLSKEALEKLLISYRLYGNYHQYYIQTHLYLMNKLTLTNVSVECFQIYCTRKCSMEILKESFTFLSSQLSPVVKKENENMELEKLVQEIGDGDVRICLYLKTLAQLIENKQDEPEVQNRVKLLSSLLVLHVALLTRLSLIDRHLPLSFPSMTFSSLFSELIIEFQRELALNLSAPCLSFSWSKVIDLFDGRLFYFTLHQIHQPLSSNIRFDSTTFSIIKRSLTVLNIPFTDNLFHDVLQQIIESKDIIFVCPPSNQSPILVEQTHKQQTITKISNRLIDKYLNPILSSEDQLRINWINPNDSQAVQYKGKYHWHIYKEVGHEISRIRDNDKENKMFSDYRHRTTINQKLYNYFQAYGESLTNSDVKDSKLQIILPLTKPAVEQEKQQKKRLTKAEAIIAQNKRDKEEKCIAEETQRLTNIDITLKKTLSDNYSAAIDIIDVTLPAFETAKVRLQLLQRKFDLERNYLHALREKPALTIEEKSKLEVLQVACFATMSAMVELEDICHETDIFNKKKTFMEELIDHAPFDLERWYRFQMEKVNSRLPRREQDQPDDRILLFSKEQWNPDPWQVEFLDAIDQQQSVIIVAPTASGKTYASYYAMYQVLHGKFGPYGVCVYVAPTKALVNQVAATIYSKLGPVFGVFTRDFRERVETCRILVTVPQCLEILLLSPTHQEWCKRMQYCIFDEIHCMSSIMGSEVWERNMLLINCPMIGLSATVNNGEDLCRWIESVEKQRSVLFKTPDPRQVRFIRHDERLADLNKYLYSNRQLHPLHPVGLMNAKQLSNRGLPKDFSLSPCETLQLNDAMQASDIKNKRIPTLTEHFSPGWICERSQCNKYSVLVRGQFEALIANREDSHIDSIATALRPMASGDNPYPESKPLSSLIVEFVLTLKEKDLLPCIVFTDNRRLCERMAQCVTDYLAEQERQLRETKYKTEIEAAKQKEMLLKKKKKPREASAKRDKRSEAPPQDYERDDEILLQLSGYERKLLYGVLDECTLVNPHGYDRKLVAKLSKRAAQHHQRLASYMKRGVAYHHAELFNKGRVAVEALFRNRYIQIVFSTATLAMGIHMPTKTVAFINDSIFLDALSYRQSSGRAGRRGFDIQGNIVFIDIPIPKIRHLITSAIPDIRAHSPTSVTFLMRLLQLCSNSTDKKDAVNRSLIALQCPFISQIPTKRHLVELQTRFHCLHTLDFLHRIHLINGKGDLIGLAGLSTHLNYNEPANILLVYLINNELFHGLTDQIDVVNTLARLFTNMPWLVTRKQFETLNKARRQRKLNAKLFLPPMSGAFIEKVRAYNSIVKDVYGSYIENVARQMRSTDDQNQELILPFSGISFIQSDDYDDGTFEYHLHHHYSQQSSNPSISPFACVSGLTHEQYVSNYNLSVSSWDLAYDLDLSSHVVPFVDLNVCDHTNSTYYLNSYAADFFKHGSEALLISENQLSANDTNKLLTDFHLVLSSIKTSLQIIVENEEKITPNDMAFFRPLYESFLGVHKIFSAKFYEEYPRSNKF